MKLKTDSKLFIQPLCRRMNSPSLKQSLFLCKAPQKGKENHAEPKLHEEEWRRRRETKHDGEHEMCPDKQLGDSNLKVNSCKFF